MNIGIAQFSLACGGNRALSKQLSPVGKRGDEYRRKAAELRAIAEKLDRAPLTRQALLKLADETEAAPDDAQQSASLPPQTAPGDKAEKP